MRNQLIVASVLMGIASVAGAGQGSSGDDSTNSPGAAANQSIAAAAPSGTLIHQSGSFGLGPLFGEPTGLTGKLWLSDKNAVDMGAAWSFVEPQGFQLHGDFLFHKFDLFHLPKGELPLYFGVGGRVKFVEHGDNRAGVRAPVGLSYLIPDSRFEVFAEVAPILDLAPSTTLEWNGGVGLRFYFQ
jgi:hypothetical protein